MPAEATKNDERPGRHCGQMSQEGQVEHDGEGRAQSCTCKPTAKILFVLGMLLFLASGIVMIIMSQSIKQGWYVTAARCTVPNGWHCEFYQHRHKCQTIKGIGVSCGDVQEYVPTFSIGGGSLGSSGSDIGGGISDEFSCSRYQLIEPAELEQCNQTAANLVGSVKACYYDEGSDTCYAGAGPHDEATASALQIAGIVLLVTGTLPISLPLVLFTVALCFKIVIDDITRSE